MIQSEYETLDMWMKKIRKRIRFVCNIARKWKLKPIFVNNFSTFHHTQGIV